jgi:hypothetical protein
VSQKKAAAAPLAAYTKEQFLASKQFTAVQKDVLRALLKDGETYTVDQAQKLIDDFAKRKVT